MRNLVIIFFILAVMVIGGSSCSYRQQGLYYGKTNRHYGAAHRPKMKNAYWGKHKYGYKGHASRGWYR
jgi:hypothetical protein